MKIFWCILRRIDIFLCDLALMYALFYLLMFVRPIGFPISAYFFVSVILYFGLSYWLFRESFMQKMFDIEITKRNLNHFLFKLLWIAIIPLALSVLRYDIFLILYILIILVLSIIILLFTKKSLWQLCSGAQIELQKNVYNNKTSVIILLVVIMALLFFPLFHSNFRFNIAEFFRNNKKETFPISIPEKAYYVKNIREYKEEPVSYVRQLFDKYDIVILCERWHPEYTQWEFFSKIVLNDTFAAKIRNVFTELGQNQKQLDIYMNTHFSTEEDLQRATAKIARDGGFWPLWQNTNFYDFLLHLHQYNEISDSLHRINLFFTDDFNWDSIKTPVQYDSLLRTTNRDSIMAYHVINRYEAQHLNKCLIITNSVHAWNFWKLEATYIFEKYPDQTAVVWINGTTQTMPQLPAMNGTLDAAALEIPDSIWAIDFKKCPIGNTMFDLSLTKHVRCTYKDLFVGMVYCQHPSKWENRENYPFILDNYRDILLKRSALVGEKYLKRQRELIETGYYDNALIEKCSFFILSNLLFLTLHSILLLFLFLNLFIKLLSLLFSKKKVDIQ